MYKNLNYDQYLTQHFGNNIINIITKIYQSKGKSELFAISHKDVLNKLTTMAKIQSVESSNRIEGIFTSNKRLKQIVLSEAEPFNRDESEIAGYRSALELIHTSHDHMELTPNVILQLHKIMYQYSGQSFGGKYKSTDNIIEERDQFGNRRVRFEPVKPHLVKDYMNQLCIEYNSLMSKKIVDPLFIIPIFIFDFLCIHPFHDGNGRMSRLLTLLLLYKGGYDVGKYISIEKIIEQTKETYYDTLQISNVGWHNGTNDNAPFITYYLGVIVHAYRLLEERFIIVKEEKQTNQDRVYRYINESITPVSKNDLINILTDISKITIERQLNNLLKQNKIQKVGQGRSTKYIT